MGTKWDGPTAVEDLVGDALVVELEVAGRLAERRVENRIFDQRHAFFASLRAVVASPQRIRTA